MPNRPQKTFARRPRYELVLESRAREQGALSSLLAELKSLGERSGSAIGNAYALAASTFLNGRERLEDLNAERRFRQRSKPAASAGAPGPRRALSAEAPSTTRK
jgi:hypothetical protein